GEAYFAGGVCYGVQMLLHGGQALGWIQGSTAGLLIGIGPTIAFIALMVWLSWRHRDMQPASVTGRAVQAVFAGVGLGNLALVAIIGVAAWRHRSLDVWLIYPCVVMVLQGIAWGVAWAVRRRTWLACVAGGWFVVGIAMALAIPDKAAFVIITGLGLLLFMLVPGWVMMRQPKAD
ncbi:MAG TPA: hypothetical protein VD906_15120, partial [Caulobacteraceae bacterium]|nr:hypothetical protein [Caulobacteraceae bacterium]